MENKTKAKANNLIPGTILSKMLHGNAITVISYLLYIAP